MEVREGMSSVVLTVGPGHTLREAATRMTEKAVGAAVVIDEEAQGPGVVSERDILNSLGRGEDPDVERVGDHMTDTVISASPAWSLERAAVEMSRRHIRHLVVVDCGRAGRRALDARHRPRLDHRGRDREHDLARGRAERRLGAPRLAPSCGFVSVGLTEAQLAGDRGGGYSSSVRCSGTAGSTAVAIRWRRGRRL